MSVSLAQGGDGLGAMWGREKAEELLKKAGFEDIDIHQLEQDSPPITIFCVNNCQ